jgi:hypothetical protein
MNLFGLEIKWGRPQEDKVVVRMTQPGNKPVSQIPSTKIKTLTFAQQFSGGRGNFIGGEYDLSEIGKIEDTDSFVRQSFKKKEGLMFKEGVGLKGADKDTMRYYKARMAQIARASKIPTITLLKRTARSLIRTSNAFLVKMRDRKASGGRVRQTPEGKELEPIAGYFPAAPETMMVDLDDKTGKIHKWRQVLPDGRWRVFRPEDVIHFVIDRREGFIFGVPTIIPVIDDIRALRQIEENIELLLYQHIFPLFHYKVGTETAPAGHTEEGDREVDVVEEQIRLMPSEGAIVTPERHEITAIGAEGRALRAEGYLTHFKKRVFAGLGVSQVDMGDGDTTNRACYSEDTETLTESGWKKYWEIDPSTERIATWNPVSNQIEFHLPEGGLFLYDYNGKMYHFSNQKMDVMVTPDHDMWVCNNPYSSPDKWTKQHADTIQNKYFRFRAGGFEWQGKEIEYFDLPHVSYKCYSQVPNAGPFSNILMTDWLEFLGYYLSEGTLAKVRGQWRLGLSQDLATNTEKDKKIWDCLERLPFKYVRYVGKDQVARYWIHCKPLYLYLQEACGDYSYNKRIPREFLNLHIDQLRILFEALMLGDGTTDHRSNRSVRSYCSSSDQLIDDVQELCLRLGYRTQVGSGTRCKRVSIVPASTVQGTREQVTTVNYQGKVYCFNVPNHLFVTRRNHKVTVQGNTAQTLSRALIDSVKAIQDDLEAQWDHEVASELLLESTFGDDVLEDEKMVHLQFAEIDIQSKLEQEAHAAEMFKANGLIYDEFRAELSREPIPLPEDPEDQDMSKYPEWSQTYWKLIEEPMNLIRAVDEPYSASAQAAAQARSTSLTQYALGAAQQGKEKEEKRAAEEDRKTKVAVAKARPKPTTKKDNFLAASFKDLESDTANRLRHSIQTRGAIDAEYLLSLARVWAGDMADKLHSLATSELIRGFNDQTNSQSHLGELFLDIGRQSLLDRISYYLDKLVVNTVGLVTRRVDEQLGNVTLSEAQADVLRELHVAFDAVRYRTDFIWDVEIRKAYGFGRVLGMRFLNEYGFQLVAHPDACDRCQALDGMIISAQAAYLEDIPPLHPHSRMKFQTVQESPDIVGWTDATASLPEPEIVPVKPLKGTEQIVQVCPRCNTTALYQPKSDNYYCMRCNKPVKATDSVIEDQDKLERCVLKVKQQLRKKNPGMSEKTIKSKAFAICNAQLKKE